MASGRIPGPMSSESLVAPIDSGTLARIPTPPPGPVDAAPSEASAPAAEAAPAVTDDAIESLDLSETAKKAAYALKKSHPSVTFTSGRRDVAEQAGAMAGNVVLNRNWIKETYSPSTARDKCQKWVDDNETKTSKEDIAAGLESVLNDLTEAQRGALSKHLSGDAFDVQPVETDADAIKKTIRTLAEDAGGKFLEKEGGLVRWHAQF